MSGRKTSKRTGKGVASRPKIALTTVPAARPTLSPPKSNLLQRKYRKLIRKHLDQLLDQLFVEFTGLQFHISWAPASSHEWKARALPTGCSVCCRLSGSPLLPGCQTCGPKQLARALGTDGAGHRFTCRLRVRNYWFAIRIRGETLGIAYLQALDHSTARPPPRKRSARGLQHRLRRTDARGMSRGEFARAARFLQLIVQHVQTSSLADLRKADLTRARRAVFALEKEQARLHQALKRPFPPTFQALRRSGLESHAEQIVQRLQECIE